MVAASPISSSFYITGGTLSREAASYVARQADTDLYESLLAGEYCYVLNSRQMGKSSLLVRTRARLEEQGRRTLFLDLTKFGSQNLSAEQWYAALLAEVGREMGLRHEFVAYWKEQSALPPLVRFFDAIRDIALPHQLTPLVVFVDEIDVTLSLPFNTDEFFAAIRQCYIGRTEETALHRLTFCLLGTATPADLIVDTRTSPFNIGKRIEVRDFTAEEAAPLAQGLGESGKALLSRILYWTGGHPYLTQRLCRSAAEAGIHTRTEVDTLCTNLFLMQTARESDDNLSFVRNRLLKSEADLPALLDFYGKMRAGKAVKDDETNPLCSILKLSGVAKVESGLLKVRNRIYAHVFDQTWVQTHLPDAEKRRQRAAFRAGVMRTAAVSWVVILIMSALALVALQQKRLSDSNAHQADQRGQEALLAERRSERSEQSARKEKSNAEHSAHVAQQQRSAADASATEARWQALVADKATRKAQLAASLAVSAEAKSAATTKEISRLLYNSRMNLMEQRSNENNLSGLQELLNQTGGYHNRGFEWGYWKSYVEQYQSDQERLFRLHHTTVWYLAVSPDGKRVVSSEENGLVTVWDLVVS